MRGSQSVISSTHTRVGLALIIRCSSPQVDVSRRYLHNANDVSDSDSDSSDDDNDADESAERCFCAGPSEASAADHIR